MNDDPRYPAGKVICSQAGENTAGPWQLTAGIPPLILVDPPSYGSSWILSTRAHVSTCTSAVELRVCRETAYSCQCMGSIRQREDGGNRDHIQLMHPHGEKLEGVYDLFQDWNMPEREHTCRVLATRTTCHY